MHVIGSIILVRFSILYVMLLTGLFPLVTRDLDCLRSIIKVAPTPPKKESVDT